MEAGAAVVMTTVSSNEEAQELIAGLIGERLAACVQQVPIESTYPWEGEVRSEPELLLLIKTAADRIDAVETHLEEHHPYEVPEVVVFRRAEASASYLVWLLAETRPSR